MNLIHLEDPDLDALLRAADPAVTSHMISDEAATELRESITGDELAARRRRPGRRPSGSRSGRRPLIAVAAAIVAAAVGIGVAVVGPSSNDSAYAASARRFAEASPRLLVTAANWKVSDVEEDGQYGGEQRFTKDDFELVLSWVPGATSKDTDRAGLQMDPAAEIDGHRAWVGHYPVSPAKPTPGVVVSTSGRTRTTGFDFEAVWSDGGQAREVRGVFDSREQFLQVAQSLRRVDVNTWLDAMPAIVVKPDARRAAVKQMLADIPQPRGFDPTPIESDKHLLDRYQVGAQVTGAVTCAWIHQWVGGDTNAKRQASQAMTTWPQWKILHEMDNDGAWSQGISEIAAYMNGRNGMVRKSGQTLEQWAGGAVGCHS